MTTSYRLYCVLNAGDIFEQEFSGFEDLSDVLAEIEALTDLRFVPEQVDCRVWGLTSADGLEFAIVCR